MHVMVVGDDQQAGAFHCRTLQTAGFHAELHTHAVADSVLDRRLEGRASSRPLAERGHDGAWPSESEHFSYAAVLLDCHLPECNSACPLRQYQLSVISSQLSAPVLVIAPHADAQVKCLDAGADDFLAKPYKIEVLCARLRALMRRQWPHLLIVLHACGLRLNLLTRVVTRGQKTVELTVRETSLLEYLMRHAGQICSREAILKEAWGYRHDPRTNVVDNNIKRLRAKINAGFETQLIHTVYGSGYKLKGE